VDQLTERIAKTSRFTLIAKVATDDARQTGPARIISLSQDPAHRNFVLGQQGSDLVFRLSTPLTEENHIEPQLIAPNVFSTNRLRQLIITYDGSTLLVYIDGARNRFSLELTPGAAAWSTLLPIMNASQMKTYKAMYYALLFFPAGVLAAVPTRHLPMRHQFQPLVTAAKVVLPSIALEGILVAVSGKAANWQNLLLSLFFTLDAMIVFKRLSHRSALNASVKVTACCLGGLALFTT
jgi:hypothetical protein